MSTPTKNFFKRIYYIKKCRGKTPRRSDCDIELYPSYYVLFLANKFEKSMNTFISSAIFFYKDGFGIK